MLPPLALMTRFIQNCTSNLNLPNTMNTAMFFLNFAAILLGPVIAMCIGRHLQTLATKRDEKMHIFKVLMTSRGAATFEYVVACNTIDIVFSDDKAVRKRWKELYETLNTEKENDAELQKMAKARYSLLEAIAISLGYKDKITWETIQNPYNPKWLADKTTSQSDNQQPVSSAAQLLNKNTKK